MMVEADFKSAELKTLVSHYLDLVEETAVLERRAGEKRRLAAQYQERANKLKIRAQETKVIMYLLGHASISVETSIRVGIMDRQKGRDNNE